jgi:hypothetical protein
MLRMHLSTCLQEDKFLLPSQGAPVLLLVEVQVNYYSFWLLLFLIFQPACGKGKTTHQPDQMFTPRGKPKPQYKKNELDHAVIVSILSFYFNSFEGKSLAESDTWSRIFWRTQRTWGKSCSMVFWKYDCSNLCTHKTVEIQWNKRNNEDEGIFQILIEKLNIYIKAEMWLRYNEHCKQSVEFGNVGNNNNAPPG